MKSMETIHIVLASPSDVQEERKIIEKIIEKENTVTKSLGIYLDLKKWEDCSPGLNPNGAQGKIDILLEIEKSDIFICLIGKKIGTDLPDQKCTGVEYELNKAILNYKKEFLPDIKAYFKKIEKEEYNKDNNDFERIEVLKKNLNPLGLYNEYISMDDLETSIEKMIKTEIFQRFESNIINKNRAKPNNVKLINTTQEFVDNINNNSVLFISPDFYDVLNFEEQNSQPNVKKNKCFDGQEITISNFNNLTIEGFGATFLCAPRYANVLTFSDCDDLSIRGITLGHVIRKGYCRGGVLKLVNCNNCQLDSLHLFGCGTYGLILENCSNIQMNGTEIFDCTYGAILVDSSSIVINNTKIYDNKAIGSLIQGKKSKIQLNNTVLHNNEMNGFLFNVENNDIICNYVIEGKNSYRGIINKLPNERGPYIGEITTYFSKVIESK